LLRFVERACLFGELSYPSQFSKRRDTLRQHVPLCLKGRKSTTHRTLLDELIEMPRIRNAIDPTTRGVVHYS
jgi:phage pi2 protein 07